MPRPIRIVQKDYPYHITTRTNNREFRFMNKKKLIKMFAFYLNEMTFKYGVAIIHFVLMSTHYHLECWLTDNNLPLAMQYFNSKIAKEYNKLMERSGHLWGERYHSTIIENETQAKRLMRYIYQNPVKAGEVEKASDYGDGSTVEFYAFGKFVRVFIVEDRAYIAMGDDEETRRKNFLKLVDSPLSDEEKAKIKNGLKKQFYGSEDFVSSMKQKYKNKLLRLV